MNTIGASELIITNRGTIYHLDLTPEQVADTIITVGDPARVAIVSQFFDRVEHKVQHREFITHTGYLGKKRMTVVSSGIGPDNIDIVINELDALVNIDFNTRQIKEVKKSISIFRMGTCGALQNDVPVDSMVISSHAIGLDNLLHYYKLANNSDEIYILDEFQKHTGMNGKPIWPYIAEGSISLRKHFGKEYIQGITVTCPGFYGPQGRILRGNISFPNLIDSLSSFQSRNTRIINFEMETSAIYGLGKVLGHYCLSINTVVFNRIQQKNTMDKERAITNMIKHSLEIIEKI
ncbi:MAG TPA: nucleoside phosphorylase [Flavipsychrobacter sp.]|nr:nucleoside phosphorylase [Flavipsychrobacter sp.]